MDLMIGFPLEGPGERRTILTPELARQLVERGYQVLAERGLGRGIFIDDNAYQTAGVVFADCAAVWAAPLVLRYKWPEPGQLAVCHTGQALGALFHAESSPPLMLALRSARVRAFSYEFMSDNGQYPLMRAGGAIAGIQAVLLGAYHMQAHRGGRGVLLAHVEGAERAHVLVIGCGNVGDAAVRTAHALGARVSVVARTPERARQYQERNPNVEVDVNEPTRLHGLLRSADLVIGAILISTYDTPPMITHLDLAVMKPGAVIVDATCGYGPGYLPTAGPVQTPGDPPHVVDGILHLKVDVLPALVPVTAVEAYVANAAPYLCRLADHVLRSVRDGVVESALIAEAGRWTHPVLLQHAAFYGMADK